jgi:hypothetical protein
MYLLYSGVVFSKSELMWWYPFVRIRVRSYFFFSRSLSRSLEMMVGLQMIAMSRYCKQLLGIWPFCPSSYLFLYLLHLIYILSNSTPSTTLSTCVSLSPDLPSHILNYLFNYLFTAVILLPASWICCSIFPLLENILFNSSSVLLLNVLFKRYWSDLDWWRVMWTWNLFPKWSPR